MKREAGQVVQPQLLKRRKLLITQSNRTHQIHGIKKYGHKMGTLAASPANLEQRHWLQSREVG